MDWLQTLIAGIVQGVTEFLPVSSSGHLVIFNSLFGESGESSLALTVFLHFATLLSVVIVFYKDIWMLIREFFAAIADLLKGKPDFKSPERRFLLMVIIATIPAVVVGLLLQVLGLKNILESIFTVAIMLLVTSAFMFLIDRLNKGEYTQANATFKTTLLVGCLQAVAILPGLSRSGSTIFGGLLGGLTKEFAVKFAFILSIPAILGAGVLELADVIKEGSFDIAPFNLLIGFAAAAISGVLSIKFIRLLIKNNKFYVFGIYCLIASVFAFLVGTGVVSL